MILPAAVFSQSIFDKIKSKAKSKTEQRIDRKIDKGIDKGLDKVEEAGKPGTGSSTTKTEPAAKSAETTPAEQKPASEDSSMKSYSRFDFVPGELVVYADNFDQEAIGELPTGWNTSGNGEVVTLSNTPGKWLRLFQKSLYLAANEKEFSENFTVEFDVILNLKSTGYFYPTFSFGFFAGNGESTTSNEFLKDHNNHAAVDVLIYPAEHGKTSTVLTSYKEGKFHFRGDTKPFPNLDKWYGKPVHIAIQVQKERMRLWINAEKVYDIPKAVPLDFMMNQIQFKLDVSNYKDDQLGVYISNLKVAKGAADTRHKLVEEGKFSTTGILFDVNSDVIQPSSYGVLKEVANILKEHANMKVKIIGHTDSDGNDATNLTLSQKRAAAVVKMLTDEFGIDASRMQSEGLGETKPVGDNKTKEGKAANRRVEFIKQ